MANIAKSCDDIFNQLVQGGVSPDDLYDTVCKQVCFVLVNLCSLTCTYEANGLSFIIIIFGF